VIDDVVRLLDQKFVERIPGVEDIQVIVETMLAERGLFDVAGIIRDNKLGLYDGITTSEINQAVIMEGIFFHAGFVMMLFVSPAEQNGRRRRAVPVHPARRIGSPGLRLRLQ
jgi:hypothetical protein